MSTSANQKCLIYDYNSPDEKYVNLMVTKLNVFSCKLISLGGKDFSDGCKMYIKYYNHDTV